MSPERPAEYLFSLVRRLCKLPAFPTYAIRVYLGPTGPEPDYLKVFNE